MRQQRVTADDKWIEVIERDLDEALALKSYGSGG